MGKIKPFCFKTYEGDPQRIQNILDAAVDMGASPYCRVVGKESHNDYRCSDDVHNWRYAGVDTDFDTIFRNRSGDYECDPISIEEAETLVGIAPKTLDEQIKEAQAKLDTLLEIKNKPRKFEEGRFYPVIDKTNVHYVAKFLSGEFFIQGLRPGFTGDGWVIGEVLDIEWPEGG